MEKNRFLTELDSAKSLLEEYTGNLKTISWTAEIPSRNTSFSRVLYLQKEDPKVEIKEDLLPLLLDEKLTRVRSLVAASKLTIDQVDSGVDASDEEEDFMSNPHKNTLGFSSIMPPKRPSNHRSFNRGGPPHQSNFGYQGGYGNARNSSNSGDYSSRGRSAWQSLVASQASERELNLGSRRPFWKEMSKKLGTVGGDMVKINIHKGNLFRKPDKFKITNFNKASNLYLSATNRNVTNLDEISEEILEVWRDSLLTIELLLRVTKNTETLMDVGYNWAEVALLMIKSSIQMIDSRSEMNVPQQSLTALGLAYSFIPNDVFYEYKSLRGLRDVVAKKETETGSIQTFIEKTINVPKYILCGRYKSDNQAKEVEIERKQTESSEMDVAELKEIENLVESESNVPIMLPNKEVAECVLPLLTWMQVEVETLQKGVEPWLDDCDRLINTVFNPRVNFDQSYRSFFKSVKMNNLYKRYKQVRDNFTEEEKRKEGNRPSRLLNIYKKEYIGWGLAAVRMIMGLLERGSMSPEQISHVIKECTYRYAALGLGEEEMSKKEHAAYKLLDTMEFRMLDVTVGKSNRKPP